MGGILASILDTDTITPPERADFKVKNKKNAKAAGAARAGGARTNSEIAHEGVTKVQDEIIQQKDQLADVTKKKGEVDIMLDKVGELDASQIFSDQGFGVAKSLVPGMTRKAYFDQVAPDASKRKIITSQLRKMPIGTILPPSTTATLAKEGITDPARYMSATAQRPDPTSLPGSILQSFVDNPLTEGAVGQREQRQKDQELRIKEIEAITKGATKGQLSQNQIAQLTRSQKDRLDKGLSEGFVLQKTVDAIHSFSDPKKAVTTVRLSDDKDGTPNYVRLDNKHGNQAMRDIALLFTFIKSLDPASTVRESEIKLVGAAESFAKKWGINAKRIARGAVLTEAQRRAIVSAANTAFLSGTINLQQKFDDSNKFSESFGLDPDLVVGAEAKKLLARRTALFNALTEAEKEALAEAIAGKEKAAGGITPVEGKDGSVKFGSVTVSVEP